jgi:hypothetical protein
MILLFSSGRWLQLSEVTIMGEEKPKMDMEDF